jgi:hypothetical protein
MTSMKTSKNTIAVSTSQGPLNSEPCVSEVHGCRRKHPRVVGKGFVLFIVERVERVKGGRETNIYGRIMGV